MTNRKCLVIHPVVPRPNSRSEFDHTNEGRDSVWIVVRWYDALPARAVSSSPSSCLLLQCAVIKLAAPPPSAVSQLRKYTFYTWPMSQVPQSSSKFIENGYHSTSLIAKGGRTVFSIIIYTLKWLLTLWRLMTYMYICCTAPLTSRRCILYI
jgi:hypothetical protein